MQERGEEAFNVVKGVVQKIGPQKIIAAIVVIALIWLILQIPRPAVLTVRVSALDGDLIENSDATANYRDWFGEKTIESPAPGAGEFRFKVITGSPVDVSATASGYKRGSASYTLDADKRASLDLERDVDLVIDPPQISGKIGPKCFIDYNVSLSNLRDLPESAELSADLTGGAFSPLSGAVDVGPRDRNFSLFRITSDGSGPVEGKVRIKGTSAGLEVALEAGEPPRFEVDEEKSFSEADHEVVVEILNNGDSDVSNLRVQATESLAGKVEILEFNPIILHKDDKLKFKVRDLGILKVGDTGFIDVSADCVSPKRITIKRV